MEKTKDSSSWAKCWVLLSAAAFFVVLVITAQLPTPAVWLKPVDPTEKEQEAKILSAAFSAIDNIKPRMLNVGLDSIGIIPFVAVLDPQQYLLASIAPAMFDHIRDIRLPAIGFDQFNVAFHISDKPSDHYLGQLYLSRKGGAYDYLTLRRCYSIPNSSAVPKNTAYVDFYEGPPAFPGVGFINFITERGPIPDSWEKISFWGQKYKYIAVQPRIAVDSDNGLINFSFPVQNSLPRIAAQGVEIKLKNVEKIFAFSKALKPIKIDQPYWVGAGHPQRLAIVFRDGSRKTLSVRNSDGLSVYTDSQSSDARVTIFTYSAHERPVYSLQSLPVEKNGTFFLEHPHLGYTRFLPPSDLQIQLTETPFIVAPSDLPDGHLGALVITEHADFIELDSDVLLMYGNPEGVTLPQHGLIGYNIPITKTIFPVGSDRKFHLNGIPRTQYSYEGNAEFKAMINKYIEKKSTIEMGMHIGGYIGTADEMRHALRVSQQFDGSHIWIDHGISHVNIYRDGWNADIPERFVLPDLSQNGVQFIWTAASGDRRGFAAPANLSLDGLSSTIFFRAPELERLAGDTTGNWAPLVFMTGADRRYDTAFINDIIKGRAVYIDHAYCNRDAVEYTINENGQRQPSLSKKYLDFIAKVDAERTAGRLYVDTLSGLATHYNKARNVDVVFINGKWHIHSDKMIKGFTLIAVPFPGDDERVPASFFEEDNRRRLRKNTVDGVIYITLDLPAGLFEIF